MGFFDFWYYKHLDKFPTLLFTNTDNLYYGHNTEYDCDLYIYEFNENITSVPNICARLEVHYKTCPFTYV